MLEHLIYDRQDSTSKKNYTFAEFCADTDFQQRLVDAYTTGSTEGAGSILYCAFVSTVDSLIQITNTFKTNMTRFYKGFKRSELRYYVESNFLKVKTANNAKFTDIYRIKACVPMGYQGMYLDGVQKIDALYKACDLETMSSSANEVFKSVLVELNRTSENINIAGLESLNKALAVRLEMGTKAKKTLDTYFTEGHDIETEFGNVYKNTEDFRNSTHQLLDMESYLQKVHGLYTQLDNNNKLLTDIIHSISTNKATLSKEFDKVMGINIRALASLYDMYGVAALRQTAMEHNDICTIDRVYRECTK